MKEKAKKETRCKGEGVGVVGLMQGQAWQLLLVFLFICLFVFFLMEKKTKRKRCNYLELAFICLSVCLCWSQRLLHILLFSRPFLAFFSLLIRATWLVLFRLTTCIPLLYSRIIMFLFSRLKLVFHLTFSFLFLLFLNGTSIRWCCFLVLFSRDFCIRGPALLFFPQPCFHHFCIRSRQGW